MSDFDGRSRKLARERYWEKYDRDRYSCPDCGRRNDEIVGTFQVHHKSGNPHDNRLEKLIALCGFCHRLREDKKPSMKRIINFRETNSRRSTKNNTNRQSKELAEKFLHYNACLCSEGRSYTWVEPIGIWFYKANEWLQSWSGKSINEQFKTELVRALLRAPETGVRWEDGPDGEGSLFVFGPDPMGKSDCQCLRQGDLSWQNVGDRR